MPDPNDGSASDLNYRVVVFAEPDDPHDLAEVFESVLKMHPTDAMVQARRPPGVLPTPLDREQAERLAGSIVAAGVQAEAVSASELPILEHVPAVHHARCLETGLEIIELHGWEAALVPWDVIDLLSVGQVPQETSRHFSEAQSTSIKAGRRTGPTTVETPLPPGPEAWIICSNPFRVYRIDHKRMNYEYLGERKTDSATANFQLFINDVVARARRAYLTPATRAFLERGSVGSYSFESSEDLERFTVLHLLIHRR
jgi:hypothetical protein